MLGAAAVLLLAAVSGCSTKVARDVAAMNTSNIQRLSNLYAAFQNYRSGRGPRNEGEFKTFIEEFDAKKLAMMNVDPSHLDVIFTSERDGQPFQIRYGIGGGHGAVEAVVFERQGKDGKLLVGYTGGRVEELDFAVCQQMLEGGGPLEAENSPAAAAPVGRGQRGRRPAGTTGPPPGAPTGPQG
jgi:hypothetical protein